MKSIDIMHRQVTHMSVLIIEILRQGIVTKTESETTKQQRQKFLLQQGCSVARWIAEFDPQNVNSDNLILPTELKALYDYSNTLVKALPDFLNQTVDHRIKHAKQKSPRQSSIVIPSLSTSMANVTHMKETWNIDHRNYAGSLLSPRKLHLNMSIDSGLPSLSQNKIALTERSNHVLTHIGSPVNFQNVRSARKYDSNKMITKPSPIPYDNLQN